MLSLSKHERKTNYSVDSSNLKDMLQAGPTDGEETQTTSRTETGSNVRARLCCWG